jgi:hypothetical protein
LGCCRSECCDRFAAIPAPHTLIPAILARLPLLVGQTHSLAVVTCLAGTIPSTSGAPDDLDGRPKGRPIDRVQTLRERIEFLQQYLAEGIQPGLARHFRRELARDEAELAQLTRETAAPEQPEA